MEPSFLRLRLNPSVLVSILFIFLSGHTTVQALRGNPESPCASACQEPTSNTTASDIVCNDADYNSTKAGTRFVDCVKCQLESKHTDPETGSGDVQWGLCMCSIFCYILKPQTNDFGQIICDTLFQLVSTAFRKKSNHSPLLVKSHARIFVPRSSWNW